MAHDNTTWLIVGGGPSGADTFDAVMACPSWRAGMSVATNSGIHLFFSHIDGPFYPDFYLLLDSKAVEIHHRWALAARRHGTMLVSCERNDPFGIRGTPEADIRLPLPMFDRTPRPFRQGAYVHARYSGLLCLQLALNCGAERVGLIGFDGYRSHAGRQRPDTLDGRDGPATGVDGTRDFIAPFLQSCIDANPDVEFIQFGPTTYQLSGDNYAQHMASTWDVPKEVLCV